MAAIAIGIDCLPGSNDKVGVVDGKEDGYVIDIGSVESHVKELNAPNDWVLFVILTKRRGMEKRDTLLILNQNEMLTLSALLLHGLFKWRSGFQTPQATILQ